MAERKIVRANEPFAVHLSNGVPVNVSTGDLWWSDDSIVKGREHMFGDVVVRSSEAYGASRAGVDTETADATPGTRRAPVRRRAVDTQSPPPPNGEDERPADAQPAAGVPEGRPGDDNVGGRDPVTKAADRKAAAKAAEKG